MPANEREYSICRYREGSLDERIDKVAVEEPMEIRVVTGPAEKRRGRSLAITMRTPGNDFELAAGFLYTEGIIRSASQIDRVEYCGGIPDGCQQPNIVRVELKPGTEFDASLLQRHFYTTSSCGVCGKGSLAALERLQFEPIHSDCRMEAGIVPGLPVTLREQQVLFQTTGGNHAAGLFDLEGTLVEVREDVGRHNAMDKLIGGGLLKEETGSGNEVVVVSGRASFELVQKALAAQFAIFVAVGAPSSLAVDLAHQFNMTLIGFTGPQRFNVYTHRQRIV